MLLQVETIIEFVLGLGVLIFIHEFGHYIMARLFNIEVEEFGMGFPPRLARLFTYKGTEFTLNWIPFGAFVRPKGENDPDVPGGLASASPWKRLGVLLGGPVFNIVTGILLFSLLFTAFGAPASNVVRITAVAPGSPAEISGMRSNDIIVTANGQKVSAYSDLQGIVAQNLGQEMQIVVQRGKEQIEIAVTPRENPPAGEGALGIGIGEGSKQVTWIESLPIAANQAYTQVYMLATLPGRLIAGSVSPEESRVVGPVGMFGLYNEIKEMDQEYAEQAPASTPISRLPNRINFLAVISVALGITNLLPLPALDGGRILFLLPEILLRRRVPAKYENIVHLIGFAALLVLMVLITAQDILNPATLR